MNTHQPRARAAAVMAFVAFAVAGCGLFPKKEIVYQSFEVRVPIPVPCAAPLPSEPEWATRTMPHVDPATGEGLDTAVKLQAQELHQRKGFEEKQAAAVKGCQ